MVRRPLVRVLYLYARGGPALTPSGGSPAWKARRAPRSLDLLLRPPALLLRNSTASWVGRRPALLEPLLRLVAVRRPARARLLCALGDRLSPLAGPAHGKVLEPTQRLLYVAAILTVIHGVTVTYHHPHLRAILIVTYGFLVVLVAWELAGWIGTSPATRALPANLVTLVGLPTLSVLLFWAFFFLDHHAH